MKVKCDGVWFKVSVNAEPVDVLGMKCLPVNQHLQKGKWINVPEGTMIPTQAIVAIIKPK